MQVCGYSAAPGRWMGNHTNRSGSLTRDKRHAPPPRRGAPDAELPLPTYTDRKPLVLPVNAGALTVALLVTGCGAAGTGDGPAQAAPATPPAAADSAPASSPASSPGAGRVPVRLPPPRRYGGRAHRPVSSRGSPAYRPATSHGLCAGLHRPRTQSCRWPVRASPPTGTEDPTGPKDPTGARFRRARGAGGPAPR